MTDHTWDQGPDETDPQYRAFIAYRDLPVWQRSLNASTAVELGHPPDFDPEAASPTVRRKFTAARRVRARWSADNGWVARTFDWEQHEAKRRLLKRRDAIAEMVERHAQEGRVLQEAALSAVAAHAGQDGASVPAWLDSGHTIIRAFVEGCRIERAAYGVDQLVDTDADLAPVEDHAAAARNVFESGDAGVVKAQAALLRAARRAERAGAS